MKKELIGWDSSVLIGWITEEDPGRMKDMESVVQSMEKGHCSLIVSTLVYAEVIASTMSDGAIEKFESFMQNKEKIGIVAVDIRVARKAQEIRNRKRIRTPDAIHIATAIVGKAKIFHTFDKQLLSLNGKNEVEGLAITACDVPGMNLSLFN